MKQDKRWRVSSSDLLVVHANAINFSEARMFGMENSLATFLPIHVSGTGQKFRGHDRSGRTGNPVTFLHRLLIIKPALLRSAGVVLQNTDWKSVLLT